MIEHALDLVRVCNVAAVSSYICSLISESPNCLFRFWFLIAGSREEDKVLGALADHPLGDASPQTAQSPAKEVCKVRIELNCFDTSRDDLYLDQFWGNPARLYMHKSEHTGTRSLSPASNTIFPTCFPICMRRKPSSIWENGMKVVG